MLLNILSGSTILVGEFYNFFEEKVKSQKRNLSKNRIFIRILRPIFLHGQNDNFPFANTSGDRMICPIHKYGRKIASTTELYIHIMSMFKITK